MKKIILLGVLLNLYNSFAQEFQGYAVYESKTSAEEVMKNFGGNTDISPEMRKTIEERMKQMLQKTFILHFDKSASVYEEEEVLEAANQQAGPRMMMSILTGAGSIHYKNVKNKIVNVQKEFFGKEFSINDSLPKYDWKMEPETKVIGNYTCYKATATIETSKSDIRNFSFGNQNEKDKTKIDSSQELKKILITAWYTLDIPVNQGPENYWGLPGLILEVSDDKTVILCSKVVLNAKEKKEIKPSNKGKKVSQKEYDEIVAQKMEEMKEMGGMPRPGGFRPR